LANQIVAKVEIDTEAIIVTKNFGSKCRKVVVKLSTLYTVRIEWLVK